MAGQTIILQLVTGDPKGLRTAQVSNWIGMALAAPRTEIGSLLAMPEAEGAGVYVLTGADPETGEPRAYVGEAEVVRDRLKRHKGKEFWVSAVVFVSKDKSLTKAHARYLESRLLSEAAAVARFRLEQKKAGGAGLPEWARQEMEVFLGYVRQLLPLLGADLLVPRVPGPGKKSNAGVLFCRMKNAIATGQRTREGFVVFKGSTAVLEDRDSAESQHPHVLAMRKQLIADGVLVERDGVLVFARDHEFKSPSAAASVVHAGGASGPREWTTEDGKVTLKELDEKA